MNEKVSIIIPVYNVEQYLKRSLNSVLQQTYENLEIILVDDGSKDHSGKICDEYAKRDGRIRVFHKKNGGLSDARNYGIKIASANYITFIDSDDYVEREYIEILMKSQRKYGSNIVIAGHTTIYPKRKIVHTENHSYVDKPEIILEKMLYDKGIDTSAWAKLYKKDLFKDIKYPKGRLFEDIATTGKLICGAKNISVEPVSIYNYVIRGNSISNEDFSEKKLDLISSTKEVVDYVVKRYPELQKAGKRRIMFSYLATLSQLANSNNKDKNMREFLMGYIKSNRKQILKDSDIPKRDRYALYVTSLGYPIYRIIWRVYKRIWR